MCGKGHHCGNPSGKPDGTCWCGKEVFPKEIFQLLPPEAIGKKCICKECLDRFNHA
ncbi:cysteine-rich CWC family protein [Melghirimyces algeriensis]|uniref:cysteine-rich CWC family protein n=1 Tax=Melghirimyces algeriensis TaxID=910412 RepID=UPI001FE52F2C|nr:cysteine-rich CWC family protein [Melghirimyces algeriensis]